MQNNPLMHHNIIMPLMKALRAALNVQRVQQCVRFRVKIQTTQVQNNQARMVSVLRLKSAELYDEAIKILY